MIFLGIWVWTDIILGETKYLQLPQLEFPEGKMFQINTNYVAGDGSLIRCACEK